MPASKTTTVSRPKAYLQARHKIVKTALTTLGLDGLLLAHPPDLAYLTNFTGDDSVGIFTSKRIHLVTDFRYQEQAEIEAPLADNHHPRWCHGQGAGGGHHSGKAQTHWF